VERSVRYTPQFKRQMVDLVRSGRNAASRAKELGTPAWTIALCADYLVTVKGPVTRV
jgi:transposase-like protein